MDCPNCARPQPEGALECAHCGVIFAKWAKRGAFQSPPPAPTPEVDGDSPPRLTLGALIPGSAERTAYVNNIWGWVLNRFFGTKIAPLNPAALKLDPAQSRRLTNFLRLWPTVICGAPCLGIILSQGFNYTLFGGLVLAYLLWFPWKPVRVLASIALCPAWVSVCTFLIGIVAVGGPDGRGAGSALALPMGILSLAVLGALVYVCVADLRTPDEPDPTGAKGLLIAGAHAAAIAVIAFVFWKN